MAEFNPLSDSNIIENFVDSWRNEICQMVNGTGVMLALVPHILSQDNQSVLSGYYEQNNYTGNARLLDYLRQTKERGKWTAFIVALRQNSYSYLASLLTGEYESPKNNCHYERNIITIFRDYLADKIGCSIVSKLRTRGVLTKEDEEKIEREKDRSGSIGAAALMLFSIQKHLRPHEWYRQFLTVLRDTGFTDLVRGIEPDFIPKGDNFDSRTLDKAQFYERLPLPVAALRKQLEAKQKQQRSVFMQVKKSVKNTEELFKTLKQDLQSKYKQSRDSLNNALTLLDDLETDDFDETEKEEKFNRIASMSHPGRLEFQYSNYDKLLDQVKCLGSILFLEPDSLSGSPDSMTGSFTSDTSSYINFSLDSEASESHSKTGSIRSLENPSHDYSLNSFRSTGSDPGGSAVSSRRLFASSSESKLVGPNSELIGNSSQAIPRQKQQPPSRAEPAAPPGRDTDLTTAPSNGVSSSAPELQMETLRLHSPPTNLELRWVERHTPNTVGRNPPRTTPSEGTLSINNSRARHNLEETSPGLLQKTSARRSQQQQQQQELGPPPPYKPRESSPTLTHQGGRSSTVQQNPVVQDDLREPGPSASRQYHDHNGRGSRDAHYHPYEQMTTTGFADGTASSQNQIPKRQDSASPWPHQLFRETAQTHPDPASNSQLPTSIYLRQDPGGPAKSSDKHTASGTSYMAANEESQTSSSPELSSEGGRLQTEALKESSSQDEQDTSVAATSMEESSGLQRNELCILEHLKSFLTQTLHIPSNITDIVELDKGMVACIDADRKVISLYDSSYNCKREQDVPYRPMRMCRITDLQVAVLYENEQGQGIVLISLVEDISQFISEFNLLGDKFYCSGKIKAICFRGKKLYGCCSCRSLHMFDIDSKEQGTVGLKLQRLGTWDPQYIDISHDGKHVYVTEEKALLCFNVSNGALKWENCDDFLDPRGVACYQHCVYVADRNKNTIIELFQSDGTKTNEHGEYLDKPIAIHISESTSGRFLVTQHPVKVKKELPQVHVFLAHFGV